MSMLNWLSRYPAVFGVLLVLLWAGCNRGEDPAQPPETLRPFEGTTLRLAVVDDPALAAAARQFQGEWQARTGAGFEVGEMSLAELAEIERLSADAVIFPSHQLGLVASRKLIVPVPGAVLEDAQLQWNDVFELLRLREATWELQPMALPLGSPVFICYYRTDLFEQFDKRPPATWAEYRELAAFFADQAASADEAGPGDLPRFGSVQPLGKGWAGLVLLARAAPYAKHPDFYSTLFDMESMEPLIAGPPFVRALEELVEAARFGPDEQLQFGPDEVRQAFWRGEAALAVSWPTAAGELELAAGQREAVRAGFSELPGADEVFNLADGSWEEREAVQRVPLLAVAGRLGSVARESQQAAAAWQLLVALSGPQWSTQVSSASPRTTLFRKAHVPQAREWVEAPADRAAARDYAAVARQSLSRSDALLALPLPGRSEYLAALDEAVRRAVSKEASARESLAECAEAWRLITEKLGRQQQLEAYRASVVRGY